MYFRTNYHAPEPTRVIQIKSWCDKHLFWIKLGRLNKVIFNQIQVVAGLSKYSDS